MSNATLCMKFRGLHRKILIIAILLAATGAAGIRKSEAAEQASKPKRNLAEQNPDKLKELRTRYDKLAAQARQPVIRPKARDFKAPRVWGDS